MKLLICLTATLLIVDSSSSPAKLTNVSSIKFNTTVNRLLVDEHHDTIYVGARNFIHILRSDLTLIQSNQTNKWLDSPNCIVHDPKCSEKPVKVDTDIMGMVLHSFEESIFVIACGTAYKGLCLLMTTVPPHIGGYLGHTNPLNFLSSNRSFTMFIGPGPEGDVFYVGSEYDGRPMNFTAPLISSRVLAPPDFLFTVSQKNAVTRLDMKPEYMSTHRTRFVFGFPHEKYAYFLTTQRLGNADVETKVGRICKDDPTFFSYVELPLDCSYDELVYNFATTAYLESSGSSKTLHVAFASTVPKQMELVNRTSGSVICSFQLLRLNKQFDKVVDDCYKAEPTASRLEIFNGKTEVCNKASSTRAYCGSGKNAYIGGNLIMKESATLHYPNMLVSSLLVTVQNNMHVYFVGTESGSVFKATKVDSMLVEVKFSGPIKPDPSFSIDGKYIYMAGGSEVKKIPLDTCSSYATCGACLTTGDPSGCGWCKSFCSSSVECAARNLSAHFSKSACTPEIFSFHPTSGPAAGGTVVKISGRDFGSAPSVVGENVKSSVEVAGTPCKVRVWKSSEIQCVTSSAEDSVEGPVKVDINDVSEIPEIIGSDTSKENFTFVTPYISSISPEFGPVAGGTKVVILGKHLNSGLERKVWFGEDPCVVSGPKYEDRIACVTSPTSSTSNRSVSINIDNALITGNVTFEYLPDPVIDKNSLRHLATTASGMVNLTFTGKHLNSVAQARIVVNILVDNSKVVLNSSCTSSEDGTRLYCKPPPLPSAKHVKTELTGYCSLVLDGVKQYNASHIAYQPNPQFLHDKVKLNTDDGKFEISGRHLSVKYKPQVFLKSKGGNDLKTCNIDERGSNEFKLLCSVPTEEVSSLQDDTWDVVVRLGAVEEQIGAVELYESSSSLQVAGIVLITMAIVVVLVVLVLYLLYQRGVYPFAKQIPNFEVVYMPGSPSAFGREGSQNEYRNAHGGRSDRGLHDPLLPSTTLNMEITLDFLANENILIARDYITLGKILGEGQFGCVYKGSLKLPGKEDCTDVAVKTLHDKIGGCRDVDTESFLQEGLIMKDFKHHNVLTLIGVCVDSNNSPMIILPFMANGDLLSHIRNEELSFTIKDLLMFAIQIADGMEYLSSLKFVHRDLAARNCMVDEDKCVKVADFGLSRDIYVRDYYRSDQKTKLLPVKWMAIESLERLIYDAKTDVWSYGVLLWEIITRGVTPYPGVDNSQILPFLKQGNRMLMPEFCPELLYEIMLRCWDEDPSRRPTFSELVVDIRDLLKKLEAPRKQQTIGLDVQYVNYPPSKYYNQPNSEKATTSDNPTS